MRLDGCNTCMSIYICIHLSGHSSPRPPVSVAAAHLLAQMPPDARVTIPFLLLRSRTAIQLRSTASLVTAGMLASNAIGGAGATPPIAAHIQALWDQIEGADGRLSGGWARQV